MTKQNGLVVALTALCRLQRGRISLDPCPDREFEIFIHRYAIGFIDEEQFSAKVKWHSLLAVPHDK